MNGAMPFPRTRASTSPCGAGDHRGALVSLQTCPRLVLPPEALIASDGPDDRFRGLHLVEERNEGRV